MQAATFPPALSGDASQNNNPLPYYPQQQIYYQSAPQQQPFYYMPVQSVYPPPTAPPRGGNTGELDDVEISDGRTHFDDNIPLQDLDDVPTTYIVDEENKTRYSPSVKGPWWTLPLWSLSCLGLGYLSGYVGGGPKGTNGWYESLHQPPIQPPNWVFPVVWSTLYLMMGAAGWFVYYTQPNTQQRRKSLALFATQMVFNLAWTPLFFGLESVALGAIGVFPVLVSVWATTRAFYKVNKTAGRIMIPYCLWVSFATLLACWIWYLNTDQPFIARSFGMHHHQPAVQSIGSLVQKPVIFNP